MYDQSMNNKSTIDVVFLKESNMFLNHKVTRDFVKICYTIFMPIRYIFRHCLLKNMPIVLISTFTSLNESVR